MSTELERAIDRLRQVDGRLDAVEHLGTLDSTRSRPTPLADLAAALVPRDARDDGVRAFALALATCADALCAAFPGNLFWDFDGLAASLASELGDPDRAPVAMVETAQLVAKLHAAFGGEPIRFRYAHDFLYGYDWAKWVAKDPARRANEPPFGTAFLRALLARAEELRQLIAADDVVYPRLRNASPRNPFSFSREPEHEARLLQSLAMSGAVPVAAWSVAGHAVWDRPYQRLRADRARELGIPRGAASAPIA